MRILLADDDPDVRDVLGVLLELYGHEVRSGANGEEAMAAAVEFEPDAAILDFDMPLMNGAETASALRRRFGSDLVTVCVSGKVCTTAERQAFDHFLAKPCDVNELLAIIEPKTTP